MFYIRNYYQLELVTQSPTANPWITHSKLHFFCVKHRYGRGAVEMLEPFWGSNSRAILFQPYSYQDRFLMRPNRSWSNFLACLMPKPWNHWFPEGELRIHGGHGHTLAPIFRVCVIQNCNLDGLRGYLFAFCR